MRWWPGPVSEASRPLSHSTAAAGASPSASARPNSPAPAPQIGLAPNALRALDAIGTDAARAAGSAVPTVMGVRRSDGRWLTRTATADMAARYGTPPIAVPRPAFTAALAAELPPESLRYGTTVTAVEDAGAVQPYVRQLLP